jgi:glycosyltransferase involved in cell wall biosynthesis
MKVIISVGGRFHAFNLAQQLLKRDALKFIITSYPKFITKKLDLPDNKVKSVIIKEILERSYYKLPEFLKNLYNPQFFITEIFDKLASRKLEKADIFVGWSSFSLHTLRKAKNMGMITILDHGSSHAEYQRDILKEEYEILGIKPKPYYLPHPKIVEKELREYEEADYICIPSLFAKRTFLEKGIPENKILHIPYGVDLSQFKRVPKKDNVFRVIFVGAMSLQKGVHYLLQAFSELNLPNSELWLIGPMTDEIKSFFQKYNIVRQDTRKYASSKIKYLGFIPQRELYKYYSQGSVFVLNSIQEGLAMVQLQAMACGLPVIATTNTGGEDVIRDGIDGFIIPIRDIEKLKEKILYLYENPEICKQMGQNAKKRAKSGFTWEDYGNKIYENYQKILKQNEN